MVFSRVQDIGSVSFMLRERKPCGEQVSLTGDSHHLPLCPRSFPELEEEEPQETSHLLTPPPTAKPSETKGKQLGNLSDGPLVD